MKRKAALFLALLSFSVISEGSEWPKRFLEVSDREHTVVVLYEDGQAAYSTWVKRQGRADWVFVASRARWEWCKFTSRERSEQRCLSLHVDGVQFGEQVGFRFDYFYEESKLTEFDKMGIQSVLKRNDKD
jgi:hypothetical protein